MFLTSAAIWTKCKCSWCTLITFTANNVGFAVALTTNFFTFCTQGTLRVTLTCCRDREVEIMLTTIKNLESKSSMRYSYSLEGFCFGQDTVTLFIG